MVLDEEATWTQPYFSSALTKTSRSFLHVSHRRQHTEISPFHFDSLYLTLSSASTDFRVPSVECHINDDCSALLCEFLTPPEWTNRLPRDWSTSKKSPDGSTGRIR